MPACNCKKPPGGGTKCPEGHAAFCEIVNNVCQGECVEVPDHIIRASPSNLHAWVLTRLTGRNVTLYDVKKRPALQDIITRGEYVNPVTRSVTRFSLPEQDRSPRERGNDISGSAAGGMTAEG